MHAENSHKKSKIKVCVRKRPASQKEIAQNDIDIVTTSATDTIVIKELKNRVDLTKYIEEHHFTFDRAFGEAATNAEIYSEVVKPLIAAAFNRTKITCFAYGQTGSGKTYTMMGNHHNANDTGPVVNGLYLLSLVDVFNFLSQSAHQHLTLWVSFYEIYCNKLFDLLNGKNILYAREDGKGNIVIAGLVERNTKNLDELMALIDFGLKSRTVGVTGANLDSSRSHAVLQITIRTANGGEVYSKISFVDLAGSERAVDTIDTNKQTKIDGAEINKSLLALKECIRALDMEKKHKPFRGSKLTLVLRDSFIGNCLTLMIANISPCLSCSEHTLNTLRYADRVKELRKPKHERDGSPHKKTHDDLLSELLVKPRLGSNVKYAVELKGNGSALNHGLSHGYNYMKIKQKSGGKIPVSENKSVIKIDEIIRAEKLPMKQGLKKMGQRASSDHKNRLVNNFLPGDKEERKSPFSGSRFANYQKIQLETSSERAHNDSFQFRRKDSVNADDYVSKYKNVKIRTEEDYQMYSGKHEDLINRILEEEENFISEHKTHVDNMVESIKEEMKFIHEVEKPGSDIDQYTSNLDKLLRDEICKISQLRRRLNNFRIMLKDEEALANKFDDEFGDNNEEDGKNNYKDVDLNKYK